MLTDVGGLRVGQASDLGALTGCTVVLVDTPMLCGADIRGANTSTKDTPRFQPGSISQRVHAILLTGGSGFGLNATPGVYQYCEEQGIGANIGGHIIPAVAGAVLYDLDVGDARVRPDAAMAYAACRNAVPGSFERGNVGAGTGATVGKFLGISSCTKGGIGTSTERLANGLVISALAAVNAWGDIVDPKTGRLVAGPRDWAQKRYRSTLDLMREGAASPYFSPSRGNTTLGIIATNAQLSAEEVMRVAQMSHDGYARAINPVHTMWDGDIVFALGREASKIRADVSTVGSIAAAVMSSAILDAMESAKSVAQIKACGDW